MCRLKSEGKPPLLAQNIRDLISQPGFQNWNLELFKRFALSDCTGLQFRAEAFKFTITRTGAAAAAAECSSTRPARRSARSRPRAGERAVVSAIYSCRFAFIFEASTDWVIDR